jgi:signal transduction histidine kinase
MLGGCVRQQDGGEPYVEFTTVPKMDKGGTQSFGIIEGRAVGARPGQQIVLYARSGAWYVQPYADQPFTSIRADSTWASSTHLGTEYAALLVEPGYSPPPMTEQLPAVGGGVVVRSVREGTPAFWQTWWFRIAAGLVCLCALLAFYRYRMRALARQLNVRFEERLAERLRIAQELHDTMLQGVLSASMQLHVALEKLPADSPSRAPLGHIQGLLGQVIEEGRNVVRGLRSDGSHSPDLEQAFSHVRQELSAGARSAFRVVVEGRPRPMHPIIRDEVYRIGREAVVNAFRHSDAQNIEVGVEYAGRHLCVTVSDDGRGIDPQVLQSGRDGHWGLSGMRERAEMIGARLTVRSRAASGTEVELLVPGHVAFKTQSQRRGLGWLRRSADVGEPPKSLNGRDE